MMSEFVNPSDVRLKLKHKVNYNYLLSMLLSGYVYVHDCDRRKAHYICKKLNQKLAEMDIDNIIIEYSPAEYQGKKCYAFFSVQIVK